MSRIIAERYHDISCGHRVMGQGGKCENLHGHNYRITFLCEAYQDYPQTDDVGRVLDFGEIKKRLCMWLEEHWDHKFLVFADDPLAKGLAVLDPTVVWTSFNPTAENMAEYLVKEIGPAVLEGTGVYLSGCQVEETRKCSAHFYNADEESYVPRAKKAVSNS